MNRVTTLSGLLAVGTLLAAVPPESSRLTAPIALNDNREPAGTLREGVLTLELEIAEGDWYLLGDDQPAARMWAFAERGKAPSIPGPLIRVPLGTEVEVTIINTLDTTIIVRGFGPRRLNVLRPVTVPGGATRDVRFTADVAGTFFYWGATDGVPLGDRMFASSQLSGAFIVDDPATVAEDRVLMIGMWVDGRLPDGEPDLDREFLVINGRPWPFTERLTYDVGDSVQWRIINTSFDPHAMHLHGFYYRIDARGDIARDTLYWPDQRRMAVTERINPGSTMSLVWSPDRPGGWIFHCHMSAHVIPNPSLESRGFEEEDRYLSLMQRDHTHGNADNHAVEGMGGLMMAMYIRPPEGWEPNEPKRRVLRLFIQSDTATGGLSGRQFGYVLQDGDREPPRDSMRLPGSPLILRKGEPTAITVINRTDEPSQVHWHGLEIESYFDGVAGIGGYPNRTTPAIAPGDSFEMRITPPRAGTFMYHTHINDLRQQGSGLYGAFIVLEPGEDWDPATDRLFIFGESPFRSDEIPVLNGANPPEPITLEVGSTYRLRFMDIVLNRPATVLRLLDDGFPVLWTPVAKDGFDLPPVQHRPVRAERPIAVGETYDFRFTPTRPGQLHLELRQGNGVLLVDQVVHVQQ